MTDQLAAWRRALADKAKAARRQRGKRRKRGVEAIDGPGMMRLAQQRDALAAALEALDSIEENP